MTLNENTPIYERPTDEWLEEVIDELESRKDYGIEYGQAMEDAIVILKAKIAEIGQNKYTELIKELDELNTLLLEERPHGRWILIDNMNDPLDGLNGYKCSECGRIIHIRDHQTISDYPYCHCGADMRQRDKR